jgi:hypothetical protein
MSTSTFEKQDLLQVCLRDLGPKPPPLPEFKAAFCDHCSQPECTRSLSGTSLFDQRVQNWEDRLFKNPSRLPQDDPRFSQITAQKFVDVAASHGVHLPILGRTQVPSQSWVDPRELVQPEAAPPAATPPATVQRKEPEPEPEPEPEVQVAVKEEPVSSPPETFSEPTPPPKRDLGPERLPANTSFQGGVMIGSGSKQVAPSQDAWNAPIPTPVEKEVTVLKPGQKFRFGK